MKARIRLTVSSDIEIATIQEAKDEFDEFKEDIEEDKEGPKVESAVLEVFENGQWKTIDKV